MEADVVMDPAHVSGSFLDADADDASPSASVAMTTAALAAAVAATPHEKTEFESCSLCGGALIAGTPHEAGCAARRKLSEAARAVAAVPASNVGQVPAVAAVPALEASPAMAAPLAPPVVPAVPAVPAASVGLVEMAPVTVTIKPNSGHAKVEHGQAQHTAYSGLRPGNDDSGGGGDEEDGGDEGDADDGDNDSEKSSVTRSRAASGGGSKRQRRTSTSNSEYPKKMPDLAHGNGMRVFPVDDVKRIVSCYGYILAANFLVFFGCVVGLIRKGTPAYDMAMSYWDFGSNAEEAHVKYKTSFYAPAAAFFLASVMLALHVVLHAVLRCLPSKVRMAYRLHIGHVIAAEYDQFEALANGLMAVLAYPLLSAVGGERDGLRMFMMAGLAASWHLCLFCSDYFASEARQPKSNEDQFYVAQRMRHGAAFWFGAAALQMFVYCPILMQSRAALQADTLDPDVHVTFRMLVCGVCFVVDIIKAMFGLVRRCCCGAMTPSCCQRCCCCCGASLGSAESFIINKVLSFVTLSLIVLAGSFL